MCHTKTDTLYPHAHLTFTWDFSITLEPDCSRVKRASLTVAELTFADDAPQQPMEDASMRLQLLVLPLPSESFVAHSALHAATSTASLAAPAAAVQKAAEAAPAPDASPADANSAQM